MDPNKKLLRDGDLFLDPSRYRQMVGKLNYLTIAMPDILYAVSVVSQFIESSGLTLGRCYSYYLVPEESHRLRHIVYEE
jgi:hypothetical protein